MKRTAWLVTCLLPAAIAMWSCQQPQSQAPASEPTPAAKAETGPDPTVVDAAHYKVELENERMRVIRIKYGPGEKYHLRWWFPEDYKDMTVQKFFADLGNFGSSFDGPPPALAAPGLRPCQEGVSSGSSRKSASRRESRSGSGWARLSPADGSSAAASRGG